MNIKINWRLWRYLQRVTNRWYTITRVPDLIQINRTVNSRPTDVRLNSKINFVCLSSTQSDNVWICLRAVRSENAIGHRFFGGHIYVHHMDPQTLVQIGHILSVGAVAVVRARDALHVGSDALHGCVAQPLQGIRRSEVWWHLYNANTTAPCQRPRTNRYVTRRMLAKQFYKN